MSGLGVHYADLLTRYETLRQTSAQTELELRQKLEEMTALAGTAASHLKISQDNYNELEENASELLNSYQELLREVVRLRNETAILELMVDETQKRLVEKDEEVKYLDGIEEENEELYGELYELRQENEQLRALFDGYRTLSHIMGGVNEDDFGSEDVAEIQEDEV